MDYDALQKDVEQIALEVLRTPAPRDRTVEASARRVAKGVIVRLRQLTEQSDPVKAEQDLMRLLPKTQWVDFSHRMIYHGRAVCQARKPTCDACSMQKFCPRVGVNN